MSKYDDIYRAMVNLVLSEGEIREDRTGVGTVGIFGHQYKLRVSEEEFPILTTKKIVFSSVVKELRWFIAGETNISTLGCGIWDSWAEVDGELKYVYGEMWRKFPTCGVDQISGLVYDLIYNKYSRRHIVTAWHPLYSTMASLPACHTLFQCYVTNNDELDLHLYQRSADLVLGVPFNTSSYALLLILLAKKCNLKPRNLVHSFGDLHIYSNHIEKIKKQIEREAFHSPSININKDKDIYSFTHEDIELNNYEHHPFMSYPVAV